MGVTGKKEPVIRPGSSELANHIYYRFWINTNLIIYEEWLKEGKKTPVEAVIDIAVSLMENGLGE